MKRSLLLGCISLFVVAVFAQEDPVLMRVNRREILRSEFEYAYRRYAERSNARLSSKEYAALFAQSKLKVEAARLPDLIRPLFFVNNRRNAGPSWWNLI